MNKVICMPIGGIGNQFFQFFFTYYFSLKTNRKHLVSKRNFYVYKKFEYCLDKIIDNKFLTHQSSISYIYDFITNNSLKISDNLIYKIDENIFSNVNQKKNLYIMGYWQSFKFLNKQKNIFDILNSSFSNNDLVNDYSKKNYVALHIRRGDYFKEKNVSKIHGILSDNYYKRCIKYFLDKFRNPFFYIFSDDKDYVSQSKYISDIDYQFINLQNNIDEFALMSYFKNFIISNSTFSLIPSFLSSLRYSDVDICVPNYWVNNILTSETDLISYNSHVNLINI